MNKIKIGTVVKIYCEVCMDKGRGAVDLIVRTNRENQSQFLGCPNYPTCTNTEKITEAMMMKLQGHPTLFD